MTPVRVVIADDHPMFRFGLREALACSGEVDIVGEAADGLELAELVAEVKPRVAPTDLAMPGVDGLSAIETIRQQFPQVAVLVLTMNADEDAVIKALRAGARGYLLKGADRNEIVQAVLTVSFGGHVYSGTIGEQLTQRISRAADLNQGKIFPELTNREHEVLAHVASGQGNHEIGRQLHLSEKTIRIHMANILMKLGLRDRSAAVAPARPRSRWGAMNLDRRDGVDLTRVNSALDLKPGDSLGPAGRPVNSAATTRSIHCVEIGRRERIDRPVARWTGPEP